MYLYIYICILLLRCPARTLVAVPGQRGSYLRLTRSPIRVTGLDQKLCLLSVFLLYLECLCPSFFV